MPGPPRRSYPEDNHVHHGQLQPGTLGYFQYGALGRRPSPHQMLPPPIPVDRALIDVRRQQVQSTQGQLAYNYSQMFNQPRSSDPVPYPPGQGAYSAETERRSDEDENDEDEAEKDEEVPSDEHLPVTKGKRAKSTGGSAPKKAKRGAGGNGGGEDDSPVAGGSAPSGNKPKATRAPKACTNCQRHKIKCVFADHGPPCKRCQDNSQDCIFEESGRGKNRGKRREKLARKLEQAENMLDALKQSISRPGYSSVPASRVSRPPTPHSATTHTLLEPSSADTPEQASTSGTLLAQPQGDNPSSPRLNRLPNSLNPLGALAVASLQILQEKGGAPGILPSHTIDDGGEKQDGRPVGVTSDTYFKPGPMNILPLRRPHIERQIQPEMLSIVTLEEVHELFAIYFEHMNTQCGLLEQAFHTPSMVCSRSPFLLTTICAIAAMFYDKRPELYQKLSSIAKKLAFSVLERGYKSVEIVQAYILLTLWGTGPVERYDQDKTWLMLGLALRLATDLNLHRKNNAQLDDSPESHARTKEIRNRERTWLLCFALDRSLSAQMGKPHSIKEDYITRNSGRWWRQPDAIPEDKGVVAYLELHRVLSRSLDLLYSGTDSTSGLQTKCDYLLVVKTFESQLLAWSNNWEYIRKSDMTPGSEYRSLVAEFYYHYAVLMVNSFGLQDAIERSHVNMPHFLSRCQSSAMACAMVVRNRLAPRGYLRYAPDSYFVFTSYAVLTLINLIRPEFPAFVKKNPNLLPFASDIADVLGKVAVNHHHTPALYSTFLRAVISAKKESAIASSSLHPTSHGRTTTEGAQTQQTGSTMSSGEPTGDIAMGEVFLPPGDGILSSSDFLQAANSIPQLDETFPSHWPDQEGTDDALGIQDMFANGFWDSVLLPGYGNQLGGLSGGFVYGAGGNSGYIASRAGSPFASGATSPLKDADQTRMGYAPYAPVFREMA